MENLKAGEKAILDKHEIVFVETLGVYASVIRHNNGDRIEVMNRRINKLYTVRILFNGNARTVNPVQLPENCDTPFCTEFYEWQQAESACVELPIGIWTTQNSKEKTLDSLLEHKHWYAYRDNDTWILVEPVTHQPNT